MVVAYFNGSVKGENLESLKQERDSSMKITNVLIRCGNVGTGDGGAAAAKIETGLTMLGV